MRAILIIVLVAVPATLILWVVTRMRRRAVTVRVLAPQVPPGETVFITGNQRELGRWNPSAVALERQEDGSWTKDIHLRRNSTVEFKITRGSWATEAADAHGRPTGNFQLTAEPLQTFSVAGWRDLTSPGAGGQSRPVDGTLKFHRNLSDGRVAPRHIVVWLPPGYQKDQRRRYPVLYMHDGQNLFDPATAFTGVDWQADVTAARLISEKRVRPFIIVGIYNCDQRLAEYSLSAAGEHYRAFIIATVKPLIDKTYRTLPDRLNTATMGSSMGGLVSFLLTWQHSEVFSAAACLSPSFIYEKNQVIKWLRKSPAPALPVRLYVDCGGEGGEKLLLKGCRKVLRVLRKKGIETGEDFQFHYFPDAGHSEWAWAKRLWRPLLFIYREPSHDSAGDTTAE